MAEWAGLLSHPVVHAFCCSWFAEVLRNLHGGVVVRWCTVLPGCCNCCNNVWLDPMACSGRETGA